MSSPDSYFLPFQLWKELPFCIQGQLKVVNALLYFTFLQANNHLPALKQAESLTQNRSQKKNQPPNPGLGWCLPSLWYSIFLLVLAVSYVSHMTSFQKARLLRIVMATSGGAEAAFLPMILLGKLKQPAPPHLVLDSAF